MKTPARTTAEVFPQYIGGEVLADSAALKWPGLFVRRYRFSRVADGFLVPATAKERDIVERFLRSLGHSQFRLTNPNLGLQLDTGFDVFVELDGRQLGIQVTEFHSDEGTSPGQKGSNLRREEMRHASSKHGLCDVRKPKAISRCPYSSVYLYNMMGIGGPSIYQWDLENGWWKIR